MFAGKNKVVAAIGCLVSATGVQASVASFGLQARVFERCAIVETRYPDLRSTGRLDVIATCNTERFRLVADDVAGSLVLSGASVDDGALVNVQGRSVAVRSFRPGTFRFQLTFAGDLTQAVAPRLTIET